MFLPWVNRRHQLMIACRNGNVLFLNILRCQLLGRHSILVFFILRSTLTPRTRKKLSSALPLILRQSGKAFKACGISLGVLGRREQVTSTLQSYRDIAYGFLSEMSKAERLLAYSLLSLITSKPLASAPMTGVNEEDEQYNIKGKGLLNEDGAWCWREGCQGLFLIIAPRAFCTDDYVRSDCLKLTKAMQKTSETLQSVADLYDDHVGLQMHRSIIF